MSGMRFEWLKSLFGRRAEALDGGVTERAFGVRPALSRPMEEGLALWYSLYVNDPPWGREDERLKPSGLPAAMGRELTRNALAEFELSVSGGARAEYIGEVLKRARPGFARAMELGLCLGGAALRPCLEREQLYVDVCGATAFTPTAFDGNGRAVGGVFRETAVVDGQSYTRLECHGFEPDGDYVIRSKAYRGQPGGQEVPLSAVHRWAELAPEVRIEDLEGPLFAYFKNPGGNDIDPGSPVGASIYGAAPTVELLREAEEQWYLLRWEYRSGKRKIYSDGSALDAGQFEDELFLRGRFTADGDLFETFSPAFRDEALYKGFQDILRRLEYAVGLSYGSLSDPQTVEKTATEVLAARSRQRTTVKAIQESFQGALEDLAYALDAFASLYGLAPEGDYALNFSWGDGVLDDPDTLRQDKALMLQEIAAGITSPWEYRVAFKGESEETAKAMLAGEAN